MLVAAAVCPHPPLLVPEVAGGAAAELDDLRAACRRAIDVLLGAAPELLVVVGAGSQTRVHPAGAVGSFEGYGVPARFVLGEDPVRPVRGEEPDRPTYGGEPGRTGERKDGGLPLSLTVGAWLLTACRWAGPIRGQEVAASATPEECRTLGETLGIAADRTGLLVMGDGSACRSRQAPGGYNPAAEAFDSRVAEAFLIGDPAALLDIDPGEADRLLVAGRAPWQVLAGAAADEAIDTQVLYDAAPYGVGYVVAVWEWHG